MMWVDSGEWRQAGKKRWAVYTQSPSVPYMEKGTKEIFVYKLPILPLCVMTSSAVCVCILIFLCVCLHKCLSVFTSVSVSMCVCVVVVYLL